MRRVVLIRSALIALTILFVTESDLFAQCRQDGSSVICVNTRFQFLTPSLVRMEYSPTGRFTNGPTAVVTTRNWKRVDLQVWGDKKWVVAKTSEMILRYVVNSGPFKKDNLEITWKEGQRRNTWTLADTDQANLGGILYSLDGLRKNHLPKEGPGILSRNGTFLLDDSRTPTWDQASGWIAPRREQGNQDFYFFAYGKDYAKALKLFAQLCGDIPMIPRYTLGSWITDLNYEYLPGTEMVDKYQYTDKDVKKIVERFRSEGIPLDILVLDYAWHRFGWKGGYDWSPIFPDPREFLDWAHASGLKVSLNDHPGYGKESVLSDEDSHAAAVRTELQLPKPEKPTYTLDLSTTWKFRTDPADSGVNGRWFAKEFKDAAWDTIQAGSSWEEQGHPGYDGVAWYRQDIFIPVSGRLGPLFLIFGGVDDEYDLYINGDKIAHYGSPNNSVYNTVTSTDCSAYLRRGEDNLIVLRVNDWGGAGGITAPPFMIADKAPVPGIRFNLADQKQAQVFMRVLHRPLMDQGVDFWWVDGGRGESEMAGLDGQMWTNRIFYDYTEQHTKKRGFIFSRYGGWGSHRYPAFFTGDTHSQWEVLAYEVPFTAQGGNVLMPYITHDIGGFIGPNVSFDLYTRWVQFGVFSPFLRLHSAHENPQEGNVRMPWTYGDRGIEMARKFFRLRYSLIPYIYTYTRIAHDDALPIVRPLYLEDPALDKAYDYPGEYFFGEEMLVAPVTDSLGSKEIYLPPGDWVDFFTGEKFEGNRVIRGQYPLDRMPVFVKEGSIIPMQRGLAYSDQRPLDTLIVDVYGPSSAKFQLYEDDGVSLDYRTGKSAWTPLEFKKGPGQSNELTIGPTKGTYTGQVKTRAYELRFHGLSEPHSVAADQRALSMGAKAQERYSWDATKSVLTVFLRSSDIRKQVSVVIR
jgi:alpha-glucosidase (family GH31 glycosyl hydrolase)